MSFHFSILLCRDCNIAIISSAFPRSVQSRVRYHSGIQQVHITQGPIYMQYPGQVLTSSTIQTGENGLPASVTTATTLIMAPPDYNTAIGSPPQYDGEWTYAVGCLVFAPWMGLVTLACKPTSCSESNNAIRAVTESIPALQVETGDSFIPLCLILINYFIVFSILFILLSFNVIAYYFLSFLKISFSSVSFCANLCCCNSILNIFSEIFSNVLFERQDH